MRRIQIFGMALAIWFAASVPGRAQSVQTGNIHGRVVDQSSAMLPGVSISLESPALLLPQQRVSDTTGEYRFDQLPVGVYRMTFELSGFQKLVRENVQITAAFSAEINGQLQIGALEESITVSGASPVIDTTSSTSSVSLPASVLADKLPVTRVMQGVLRWLPACSRGRPTWAAATSARRHSSPTG